MDARHTAKSAQDVLEQLSAGGHLRILDPWMRYGDRERHQASAVESRVDLNEVVDRTHQQTCADGEHDGRCHFGDHETISDVTQSAGCTTGSTLLQRDQ